MNLQDKVRGEYIGCKVMVEKSSNPCNIGLHGKVIDETKNTLRVQTCKGSKTIIKKECCFVLKRNNDEFRINGNQIDLRPEDRVKKIRFQKVQ